MNDEWWQVSRTNWSKCIPWVSWCGQESATVRQVSVHGHYHGCGEYFVSPPSSVQWHVVGRDRYYRYRYGERWLTHPRCCDDDHSWCRLPSTETIGFAFV